MSLLSKFGAYFAPRAPKSSPVPVSPRFVAPTQDPFLSAVVDGRQTSGCGGSAPDARACLYGNIDSLLRALAHDTFDPLWRVDGQPVLVDAGTGDERDFAVKARDGGRYVYYDLNEAGMRDAPQNIHLTHLQNQALAALIDGHRAHVAQFDPTGQLLPLDARIIAVVGQKGSLPMGVLVRFPPAARVEVTDPLDLAMPQVVSPPARHEVAA